MFAFDIHEHVELGIWRTLEMTLPEGYQVPDQAFLQSFHRTIPLENFDTRDSLVPENWNGDAAFWMPIQKKVPSHFRIPDFTLLKRMFDVF